MLAYWLDIANLFLRWAHVVVAIAWIGSSFYFVWLDDSLTPPEDALLRSKGVAGELWAVHGGGFYNPQKYLLAPAALPQRLHWFYWESYSTWLTGFALFTLLYLVNAGSFLVDANVHAWVSPLAAGAAALAFLAAFWFLYDAICRGMGERAQGERWVGALVCVVVVFASWLACQLFSGRAAFLLVGASMATAMSANVLVWIIPGQRRVIAQMKALEIVDPAHARRAKQRSVHNTYFTLPVLFAMLSNHYGALYEHPQRWLVLVLLMLAGALVRRFFVARHKTELQGQRAPWGQALAGAAIALGVAAWVAPRAPAPAAGNAPVAFEQVRAVVEQRCVACHNEQLANKGIDLHTPQLIARHAPQLVQQAVVQRRMPLNNATGMTEEERALISRWWEQGASTH